MLSFFLFTVHFLKRVLSGGVCSFLFKGTCPALHTLHIVKPSIHLEHLWGRASWYINPSLFLLPLHPSKHFLLRLISSSAAFLWPLSRKPR